MQTHAIILSFPRLELWAPEHVGICLTYQSIAALRGLDPN